MAPKFSSYPWDRLPRASKREAQLASAIARWIGARALPVRIASVGAAAAADPHAASCEVRIDGVALDVRGPSALVRALAQDVLGGPPELAAPRPLTTVEHAVWALAVARAARAVGVACEVWPRAEPVASPAGAIAVELIVGHGGVPGGPHAVVVYAPPELALRAAPRARVPGWTLSVEIVVARCALPTAAVRALRVRDLVTVDRCLELAVLGGAIALRAAPNAVVAEVASGYVPRAMALPDEAQVELTVALGTTQLALRDVLELAVGQIVQLGRPLGGPFEVRAAGRLVGRGELVDVDGELAVRIVSLES